MDKKKMKPFFKTALFCMLVLALVSVPDLAAFAADAGVVTAKFDRLKNLVSSIISSIGTIVCLWGVSEFGMALQGNDGMMQSHSFKRIGGGLIMILAPQILTMLS